MKTHNIFSKVGGILSEINEQYQYLSESPENLNDLELELLSANADFLAEHIKVLKKLNLAQSNTPNTSIKTSNENLSETQEYQQNVHEEVEDFSPTDDLIKQEFPEDYASFSKPVINEMPSGNFDTEIEDKTLDELNQEANERDAEEEAVRTPEPEVTEEKSVFNSFFTPEPGPVKAEDSPEPKHATPDVAEPIVNEVVIEEKVVTVEVPDIAEVPEKVPTLNEMMSAQRSQSAPLAQLKRQPVSDLKSIINLNDKLLFTKDLFNGYSLAYSEAIEIINRFDSFDAADNFLKTNYAQKNNWTSKQATADKLYELLNRRFADKD